MTPASAVWQEWNFCECADPESVLALVRDALRAIADRWAMHAPGSQWTSQDDEAVNRERETLPLDSVHALLLRYVLDAANLTDHGDTVYGAWLTHKGRVLLAFLESTPDDQWMGG